MPQHLPVADDRSERHAVLFRRITGEAPPAADATSLGPEEAEALSELTVPEFQTTQADVAGGNGSGFYLMRAELDIGWWQLDMDSTAHKWLMRRLEAYPAGKTNKPLFRRPGYDAEFAIAARYLANELCEAAARGFRVFACPLPERHYDPQRYVTVAPTMLASILAAMEKAGDVRKAPGTRGGKRRDNGRGGYAATEWLVSEDIFNDLCALVCTDAARNPYIVMRTSWHLLCDADKEKFRDVWLVREIRCGRDGHMYTAVLESAPGATSKTGLRKVRSRLVLDRAGFQQMPSDSDWRDRWNDATDWYPQAAGRRMLADEPGLAKMLQDLGSSNAFTARHRWRDGEGRIELPTQRMGHRVFRDDKLDEHGRFYYPAQGLSKAILDQYTVDGEETDTGDIVCTHPAMLLGMHGGRSIFEAPYNGDIYRYHAHVDLANPGPLLQDLHAAVGPAAADSAVVDLLMTAEVIRQQWKRVFSVCLNARTPQAAVNALARISTDDPGAGHLCPPALLLHQRDVMAKPFWSRARIAVCVATLVDDPVFGPSMCSGEGARLMYMDATWMQAVRKRLEIAQIPYRDCHDSMTCPISHRDEVDAIMKDVWRSMFGHAPAVKWSKLAQDEPVTVAPPQVEGTMPAPESEAPPPAEGAREPADCAPQRVFCRFRLRS